MEKKIIKAYDDAINKLYDRLDDYLKKKLKFLLQ